MRTWVSGRRGAVVGMAWLGAVVMTACDGGSNGPAGPADYGELEAATVKACDGSDFDLQAEAAKADITYITFGAQWCTACKDEAPIINSDIVQHFDAAKVQVFQILVERNPGEAPPQSLCATWRDTLSAEFTVLVDIDQTTVDQYFGGSVAELPMHMLVERDGTIVFQLFDALPTDMQQIIEGYLPEAQ